MQQLQATIHGRKRRQEVMSDVGGRFIPFTSNMEDNSTDAGFQFTFFCDICHEGYKSRFIESSTYKKKGLFRGIGRVAGAAGSIAGGYVHGGHDIGYAAQTGGDVLGDKFEGQPPEWHREHERAFEIATNEAKGHFKRCPRCHKFLCDNDWNEEAGLCIEDAPREAVEVAAARADKMKQDIQEKAQQTQVFTGEIEQKQTLCPKCGKSAGGSRFCNNCGAPLGMMECKDCGAKNPPGTRFCGECGGKL
jgi:hypothetical protein